MFCRKCGKTLLDGDRFCSYCGAQVIERSETMDIAGSFEEVIYNNSTNEKKLADERTDSAKEIPEDETVPKINMTQTWQDITDHNGEAQPLTPWNLEGFPVPGSEPKKTEDIKVDWDKRELLRFETMAIDASHMRKEETAEPQVSEDIKIVDKETFKTPAKTDIFEVFDRQMKAEEAEINSKNTMVFQREIREPETDSTAKDLFGFSDKVKSSLHTFGEEEIDKFYTFSKKNEEFQKLLDKEYERLKSEPQFTPCEEKKPTNIENLEINVPELPKMEFFKEEPKIEKPKAEETILPHVEVELPKEESIISNIEQIETPIVEHAPPVAAPIEAPVEVPVVEEVAPIPEEKVTHQDGQAEETPEPAQTTLPWDETGSFVGEFTADEKGKKISPLAVILGIVIILLAAEVAILGIKCFFPESSAAAFINKNLAITTDWVDALRNKGDDKKAETDKKENDKVSDAAIQTSKEAATPKIDPLPNPDKTSLVAEALPYNINIKTITADDTLIYDPNKSYSDKNINNSKTIENNIWYTDENGNPTFYDKEVVKTIIRFDSAWIDYVNKKDEAVFGLLKEGSPAYKTSKGFSKLGKVAETFEILKIGEIRQSETGFYVWVYEEIAVSEKSKTKTATYNYVYYMEPVEKQLKIVSYEQV